MITNSSRHDILENKEAGGDINYRVMRQMVKLAIASPRISDFLNSACQCLLHEFTAHQVFIATWNPGDKTISRVLIVGEESNEVPKVEFIKSTETYLREIESKLSGHVTKSTRPALNNQPLRQDHTFLMPLVVRKKLCGLLLIVRNSSQNAFLKSDREVLKAVASQLAFFIENFETVISERDSRRKTDILRRLSETLSGPHDLRDLLDLILKELDQFIQYDSASIMLSSGDRYEIAALRKFQVSPQIQTYLETVTLLHIQEVLEQRHPVIIPDTRVDARWLPLKGTKHIRCWMGIPLVERNKVIGLLNIDHKKPGHYSEEDAELALVFANQAAIAIENSRLLAKERRQVEQLDALRATVADISSELDLTTLLKAILVRASKMLNATGGDVGLLDKVKQTIAILVSYNMGKDYSGTEIKIGEGAMGMAVLANKPVIIEDYKVWEKALPQYQDSPLRAAIAVPLNIGGEVVGVLGIMDSNPQRRFSDEEQHLLMLFAQHAAIAIQNARFYQSAKDAAERRQVLHQVSQEIVTASLDPESIYTFIHRAAVQLMDVEAFVISIYKDSAIEGTYLVDRGRRMPPKVIPMGKGLSGHVIATGEAINIPEVMNFIEVDSLIHFGEPNSVRSILAVPMRLRGNVVGMLSAQSYRPFAYKAEDQTLLEMLASYAAIALDNAQLFIEIQNLAITDELTQISNRRHLFEMGQHEFIRARRFNRPFSVIMLDIDNFKLINDEFGHPTGDKVLHFLAQLLKESVRDIDLVSRYGGEEFVVLLTETGLDAAAAVAERIRMTISQGLKLKKARLPHITVSMGVAVMDETTKDFTLLIQAADSALYRAKNSGRNRIELAQ